jgi:hypothetical protein
MFRNTTIGNKGNAKLPHVRRSAAVGILIAKDDVLHGRELIEVALGLREVMVFLNWKALRIRVNILIIAINCKYYREEVVYQAV